MPKATSSSKTRYGGRRANTTPYSLRSRVGGGGAPPINYNARENADQWDGLSRPSFTDATVLYILNQTPSRPGKHGTEYECSECEEYFHQKGVLLPLAQGTLGFITIDHNTPWQVYISDHAEPEEDGTISRASARKAYNDVNNLVALCLFCNSAKNGYSL